jgi:ferredoxin
MDRLLHAVLDNGFIDDGQHFLGLRLRGGEKPRPEACGGENGFADFSRHKFQFGAVEGDWQLTNCVSPSAVLCIGTWEKTPMAYVIAEPCIGTKDTACVDACPVDCIHPKKDEPAYETSELLYIDPVECIDCGACVPVCPVSAIFALDDLPEKWSDFTAKNAAYYGK